MRDGVKKRLFINFIYSNNILDYFYKQLCWCRTFSKPTTAESNTAPLGQSLSAKLRHTNNWTN